jgi:hypothetical protein
MSYSLENLVRECSEIKSPSARLLAMVLASSADNKTFKCRPGWKCLMHWCKFSSKGTMSRAMKEVLASGIVTKFKKGRKSTTEYTFNLARLKELAVPFKHPEQREAASEEKSAQELRQELCTHDWSPRGYCRECEMLREDYDRARERGTRKVFCFHGDDCSRLPDCDCWCHQEQNEEDSEVELDAMSSAFEIVDD